MITIGGCGVGITVARIIINTVLIGGLGRRVFCTRNVRLVTGFGFIELV